MTFFKWLTDKLAPEGQYAIQPIDPTWNETTDQAIALVAEDEVLIWETNGNYLTAQFDISTDGQAWFSIHGAYDAESFELYFDVLSRARHIHLGNFAHLDQARKSAEEIAKGVTNDLKSHDTHTA